MGSSEPPQDSARALESKSWARGDEGEQRWRCEVIGLIPALRAFAWSLSHNGSDADDLYEIALRELEIPLFAEVLNHCDGNHSRAAAMLGIHRATLRKKLREYGIG